MARSVREIELDIEKPVAGGAMVAHHKGKVVLVRGAIPGERVLARVDLNARDFSYASVTEVLSPSPDRRVVTGDSACGGHVYAHVNYKRQLVLKREIVRDAFSRIARVNLPSLIQVFGSDEHGYRMRARFHLQGDRIGFLREGTHSLCNPSSTGQLLHQTGVILEEISEYLRENKPLGIRAIDLAENLSGDQRVLHLNLSRQSTAVEHFSWIASIYGVTGLTAEVERGNIPFLLGGASYVSDSLREVFPSVASFYRDVKVRRHAAAFFQGNRYLLSKLVSCVVRQIPDGSIFDLYAGVGLFSMALAGSDRGPVTAVEQNPLNVLDLRANAIPFESNIQVRGLSVEDFLHRCSNRPFIGSLLVNPPRVGLSRGALEAIVEVSPKKIVYVACDVATLARDVRKFLDVNYELEHIEVFDLFPNTAYVEVLAVLQKNLL